MYLCQLKDISEAVETGYFDVAARMLRNLIKEIEESNEQHEWVGLDPEQMRNTPLQFNRGALWAERYLKEKNGG